MLKRFSAEAVLGSDKGRSKVAKIKSVVEKHKDINECWYIGDTKGDILEGIEAGVDTVAVSWGWHTLEQLEEAIPYHIVDEPKELVVLFED
ncbi:MAG: HAD family hydrolase [Planctomycetota bacterium]